MARKPSRRRHKDFLGTDINLIPVMNLFMVLIPFLLLTAVFANTTIIDIRLPQEKMKASEKKNITADDILTVHVTPTGFRFSGLGKHLSAINKKGGSYDFDALSKALSSLKDSHKSSEEVILMFQPETPYETVIKSMDATR